MYNRILYTLNIIILISLMFQTLANGVSGIMHKNNKQQWDELIQVSKVF